MVEQWMTELSNWGRWGAEDQLGALNLITPAKRREAAALVREGFSVSLARTMEKEKADDNPQPLGHEMRIRRGEDGSGASMDIYTISYHGFAHTHLDSLAHIFHDGRMFNGFSDQEVTEAGAGKLGIDQVKAGVFTRGILVDLPRLKGVPYLEPGTAIYPEDLEAWERESGIRIGRGDVVFVRTGRWARRDVLGPWNASETSAGLHASCAKWLRKRDVAMVGSDAANDVRPSGIEGVSYPIHQLAIVAMGVHLFDNCDLEQLSEAAASRGRWEFLLTLAPLAVPGGTGSPVNPIATF